MSAGILKNEDVVRILNMVYSVFLAILARFSIQQTGGVNSEALEVQFLVSEKNWVPVVLLSTYFIFDWLSTNITLPMKAKKYMHFLLPVMILGIVALGGLVAFAFAPSSWWMFFFGIYAAIVPWYDVFAIKGDDESTLNLSRLLVIYGIFLLRMTIGVFVLLIALFQLCLYPESHFELSDGWLIILIVAYVVLKALRYAISLPWLRKGVAA